LAWATHESALGADPDVQRVERLASVYLIRAEEALTQRGHAKIDKRLRQVCSAQTARYSGHHTPRSLFEPVDLIMGGRRTSANLAGAPERHITE
jgi:hypothetical protein